MRRDDCWPMKTWQCECLHVRRFTVPSRTLRVRAQDSIRPHVVQFNKHDKDSVTKSLKTISAVKQLSLAQNHVQLKLVRRFGSPSGVGKWSAHAISCLYRGRRDSPSSWSDRICAWASELSIVCRTSFPSRRLWCCSPLSPHPRRAGEYEC